MRRLESGARTWFRYYVRMSCEICFDGKARRRSWIEGQLELCTFLHWMSLLNDELLDKFDLEQACYSFLGRKTVHFGSQITWKNTSVGTFNFLYILNDTKLYGGVYQSKF
jgi:hypothetical protein